MISNKLKKFADENSADFIRVLSLHVARFNAMSRAGEKQSIKNFVICGRLYL